VFPGICGETDIEKSISAYNFLNCFCMGLLIAILVGARTQKDLFEWVHDVETKKRLEKFLKSQEGSKPRTDTEVTKGVLISPSSVGSNINLLPSQDQGPQLKDEEESSRNAENPIVIPNGSAVSRKGSLTFDDDKTGFVKIF